VAAGSVEGTGGAELSLDLDDNPPRRVGVDWVWTRVRLGHCLSSRAWETLGREERGRRGVVACTGEGASTGKARLRVSKHSEAV
jgi:hypothetical protein